MVRLNCSVAPADCVSDPEGGDQQGGEHGEENPMDGGERSPWGCGGTLFVPRGSRVVSDHLLTPGHHCYPASGSNSPDLFSKRQMNNTRAQIEGRRGGKGRGPWRIHGDPPGPRCPLPAQ